VWLSEFVFPSSDGVPVQAANRTVKAIRVVLIPDFMGAKIGKCSHLNCHRFATKFDRYENEEMFGFGHSRSRTSFSM
jgi:hypothetical protein